MGVAVTAHTGDKELKHTLIVWKRQELCKNSEGDVGKAGPSGHDLLGAYLLFRRCRIRRYSTITEANVKTQVTFSVS